MIVGGLDLRRAERGAIPVVSSEHGGWKPNQGELLNGAYSDSIANRNKDKSILFICIPFFYPHFHLLLGKTPKNIDVILR
jgi:hypothetical protein